MSARWNGKWMLSAAAVALIAGQGIIAQPTPKQSLLALSKHDHTFAIVDPTTLKVIAQSSRSDRIPTKSLPRPTAKPPTFRFTASAVITRSPSSISSRKKLCPTSTPAR